MLGKQFVNLFIGLATIASITVGGLSVGISVSSADQPPGKLDRVATGPNILLVYLDDFGWKDTSYMGSDFFETPFLTKKSEPGRINCKQPDTKLRLWGNGI